MADKTYYVRTNRGSFFLTITELFGASDAFLLVGGAVFLVVIYLVFGTPFVVWPLLFDEFREMFQSDIPFWALVGTQIAFALWRTSVLAGREESSMLLELVLEGIVFVVAFEAVQCVGCYVALQMLDPAMLSEVGLDELSFWDLMLMHFGTYEGVGMLFAYAYLGYAAGFVPAGVSCLVANAMRGEG